MNKKDNTIPTWAIALIIVVVIVIIIIYVVSLGNVNAGKITRVPEEFKDSKEETKRKHDRLKAHIEKQEGLKIKLDKKFIRIYFSIRLVFVLLWFALIIVLWSVGLVNNIGDALNYSEALILLLITLNFLTFGTITKLESFIDLIKTRTENWVFGKYLNLEDKIEIFKVEIENLEMVIKQ